MTTIDDPPVLQVWWASPDLAGPRHERLLNEAERGRLGKYRRPADRARFLAGVALSRLALGELLGVAPERVPLVRECTDCAGPHGKPRLPGGEVELSVSHSGDRVAVAAGGRAPLGVDVEGVHGLGGDHEELVRRVLGPEEREELLQLPPERRAHAFFTWWSRKEALLKAAGTGLHTPMTALRVSPPLPGRAPVLLASDAAEVPAAGASLFALCPGDGYVAALAVLGGGPVAGVEERDARELLDVSPAGARTA